MRKIIKYLAVGDSSLQHLTNRVEEYILTGWQPFGGVSVAWSGGGSVYCQAVVKYKKETPE